MTFRYMIYVAAGLLGAMLVLFVVGLFVNKGKHWTAATQAASALDGTKEPYWLRVLVGIDVLANIVAGGLPGECISSRCGRWALRPHGHWVQKFVNGWLNVIQRQHGLLSMAGDLGRAQRIVKTEAAVLAQITAPPSPTPRA